MSSQQQQHVINMTGLDSGPVTTSISGALSATPQTSTPALSTSTSSSSATHIPPGAYRATPSQRSPRLQQSVYAPLSPSQNTSAYVLPTLTSLSPMSASASSSLNRSQSLNTAAYQQMHGSTSQHQLQQAYAPSSSSSSIYTQQSSDASAYRSRERNLPSYSEGTSSGALLPTINTHIPQGSFMGPQYSPSLRQTMALDTHSYTSGPPRSPVNRQQGSPYTANPNNRPVSMYDAAYGQQAMSSSRNSYHPGDSRMSPGHRASPGVPQLHKMGSNQRLRASDGNLSGMPSHLNNQSIPMGDALPLYRNPSVPLNQIPSSPYAQASASLYGGGAPPRTGGVGGYEQMNMEAATAGPSNSYSHLDRRGTMTTAEAKQMLDHASWERQRQTAEATELQQPPRPKIQEGFRRVRDVSDLKAVNEPAIAGTGRRADPSGGYVSPLKAMTAYLHHTYHLVNPAFFYELSFNPRRVLTKPSKPMHNEGHDNEDSDYILYVNDWLGAEEGNRYLILDVLGQGTFGQVVKCQNMKTREIVAVKVIKNKPAYFNQSMMEVTILEMLNNNWDPHDEHHILRLRDTFIHAKHLCLVFELLSSNLYELIKQNSFRGLSTSLVRVFTTQLLDALTVLHEARLIHCDLKPENILLKTLQTPSIKLVDFGSACHERQTVYTYIQSRFYRSPEVLLGLPYNASIDMWSLGTIAVELFLGLPLFPGTSEYNQVCRIVEMLGLPPSAMLEAGKQTGEFFNVYTDEYNRRSYKLKSLEQYSKEHNVQEQPSKRYFQATTLPDIIKTYPLAKKSGKPADMQKEMANRNSFVDFVTGLLQMDPTKRWTPQQAKLHPFITGEKLTQPFRPPLSPASPVTALTRSKSTTAAMSSGTDVAKHPYGGLPQTPSRSSGKVYHDAAAYNQHLAQQQSYNSVHQARQQAPVVNNPYVQDDLARAAEASAQAKAAAKTQAQVQQAQANAHAHAQAQAHAHAQAQAQAHQQAHAAQVQAAAMSPPYGQSSTSGSSSSYTRSRSNTMTRMDLVPGQMAKMGIEAGHSMTPIMNRDESIREWERRQQLLQNNGAQSSRQTKQQRSDYQQLDLLQQQADASHQSKYSSPPTQSWSQAAPNTAHAFNSMNRMATSTTSPSGKLVQSPPFSVIVDAQQQQQQQFRHQSPSLHMQQSIGSPSRGMPNIAPVTSPPSVYSSPVNRFQPSVGAGQSTTPSSLAAFDPYTSDVAQLMPTLQPTQYQGSSQAPPPSQSAGTTATGLQRLSMMPQYSSALYAGAATSPTSAMHRSIEEGQYSPLSNQYHPQMPAAPGGGGGRPRYG